MTGDLPNMGFFPVPQVTFPKNRRLLPKTLLQPSRFQPDNAIPVLAQFPSRFPIPLHRFRSRRREKMELRIAYRYVLFLILETIFG